MAPHPNPQFYSGADPMTAPGKSYRRGITLIDAVRKFDTEEKAEEWFIEQRWPDGLRCGRCGSDNVRRQANRKPMPFYCNPCRKYFSVKTGTVLQASNIPLSKWAIALYLYSTNLKGVSSMKLHRDLGITQKSAWHMAHRIRDMWDIHHGRFEGEVEIDETYIGGKERNKHSVNKRRAGRGPSGKTPVIGMRERETGDVHAEVIPSTDKPTLQGFVHENTDPHSTVYTDDASAYRGMDRTHQAVKHSVGEYVAGRASTNGIESFWATLKRGYMGTYHQMSVKHLGRYVMEFEGRHNQRPLDTERQMSMMVAGSVGKRLRYRDLIA